MKPNFALSLSFEGISLLHRAFPGWNRVGEVALDSPDLGGALAVLRETAEQIAGQDIACKLVIPNDQIKYLKLDLGLMGETERGEAIRLALEGATPYPVDDLAFDWSMDGDTTMVAAVARETLTEAEQFADSHGFNPVSFVATPEPGRFSGEPFFGQTRTAERQLGPDEQVQRDMAAIRVTGVARLPDPEDIEVSPSAEADAVPAAAPAPNGNDSSEHDAQDRPPEPSEPETESGAFPSEDAPAAETAAIEPPAVDNAAEAADIDDDIEDDTPLPVFGHTELAEDPDPSGTRSDAPEDEPSITVLSDSLPAEDDGDDAEEPLQPEADASPQAAPPEVAPVPSFSTMRAQRDESIGPASNAPSLEGVSRDGTGLDAADRTFTEPEDESAPPFESYVDAVPEEVSSSDHLDDLPPMPADLAERLSTPHTGPDQSLVAPPARSGRLSFLGRKSGEMASGLATSLASRSARRAEARAEMERETERQRMTVFGARKPETPKKAVGGKPRYLGLILSLVLLLFLAGVAAWASIFMDDGLTRLFGGPRQTEIVVLPPDQVDELDVEGEEAMLPEQPTEPPASGPDPDLALSQPPQPAEPQPPELVQPALPHALTEREAQARYAVTGVWQRAPQAPQLPDQLTLGDLYVTSIDPAVDARDAISLPAPEGLTTDFAMARVPLPAARGTRFQFDERGLVVARAEGALSPEGFLVFAGRPPNAPTALPLRQGGSDQTAVTPEERNRLAAKRPRSRPDGLIEENERQSLGGLTRAELAGKRPKARPELPDQPAEPQQETTDSGTEFAVAESRKPKPRPSNFAKLVEQARSTPQTTEPTETTQVAAAVPRSQVTAPPAPSKTSVAKAATVRNQINLRKINLIGVYGKPSSRRALVRLANGRYKKVQVGDRLDGGRVEAIGDSELRYSRGGRNVVLKMPRG